MVIPYKWYLIIAPFALTVLLVEMGVAQLSPPSLFPLPHPYLPQACFLFSNPSSF